MAVWVTSARHLLLDFLTLLFFALDVDLPAEQLGGKADVLAFFADGERKLGVIDDDFEMLFAGIDNGDAADFGRLQRLFGEGDGVFVILDDVDFFAAQLANDRLHAHALHADAGADGVDVFVFRHDGDLGALAGFAGDGADDDGAVVNLRHFGLEQCCTSSGAARETTTPGP